MTPVGPGAILSAEELAAVRRPYRAASLLPGRVYHDPAIFAFERERWFRRDWWPVARDEDVPTTRGATVPADIAGEGIVLARAADGGIRASGPDGRPLPADRWQGFVFASLDPQAGPLAGQLGDLVARLAHLELAALRRVHAETYALAANWKLVAENYSECYHCPPLHPQLNRLTPYDAGGDYEPDGAWQGGWMDLEPGAETMALGGGKRHGRPAIPGATALDERRVDYYLLWPATFVSVHPDYLLVHRLSPLAPDRTRVMCDWYFPPEAVAVAGFDPSDVIAFWDLTNRQDWHVCELQHRGTASRSWTAGRYATNEPSVHAFDLMCADRYADDGTVSRRTVRDRYDVAPPKSPPKARPTSAPTG